MLKVRISFLTPLFFVINSGSALGEKSGGNKKRLPPGIPFPKLKAFDSFSIQAQ
jgi:hypothetical protein